MLYQKERRGWCYSLKFVNNVGKSCYFHSSQRYCCWMVVDFVCECYRLRLPYSHYHNHLYYTLLLQIPSTTAACSSSHYRTSIKFLVCDPFLVEWKVYSAHSLLLLFIFQLDWHAIFGVVGRGGGWEEKELIDCFRKLHSSPSAFCCCCT